MQANAERQMQHHCGSLQYRKLTGYRIPGSRVHIPSAPKARQGKFLNPILTDPPLYRPCTAPGYSKRDRAVRLLQEKHTGADRSRLDSITVLLLAPRVYIPLNLGFGSLSTSCIVWCCICRSAFACMLCVSGHQVPLCLETQSVFGDTQQCLATLNSVWRRSTVFGDTCLPTLAHHHGTRC